MFTLNVITRDDDVVNLTSLAKKNRSFLHFNVRRGSDTNVVYYQVKRYVVFNSMFTVKGTMRTDIICKFGSLKKRNVSPTQFKSGEVVWSGNIKEMSVQPSLTVEKLYEMEILKKCQSNAV